MLTRCKNVNAGAVIRAKPGTDRTSVHKLLANYKTGGNFRPMSGWNGKIGSHSSVSEGTNKSTHSSA